MAPPSKAAERTYLNRIISGAALFGPASGDDVGELSRAARMIAIPRGKEIAPPKGRDAEIYVIETGAVALLDREPGADKAILVAIYGPRDAAGLGAAGEHFRPDIGASRGEWRALTNVTLVAIPVADFLRVCRRSPELSEAYISALARELRDLAARIASSLQSPLEQRLASFFARLAAIETGNNWEPTANIGRMQQTLVADMLGVSREHVNRTLIMWEKSGLIFQAKNGDVVIENRKRLGQLAGARRPAPAGPIDNEWIWEIEANLNHGLNSAAHDLAMEGVRRSPRDDRFKYFAAMSIARMGALKEALSLVESFKLTTDAPNQDIASIGPRLRRDLAFSNPAGPDMGLLRRSAEGYETVFKALKTTYPGVNAASTYAMIGETVGARALAKEVGALASAALDELDEDDPSYWERATLAECMLIEGDRAGAAIEFTAATGAVDAAPGKIATTRKQLRRLKAATKIDDAWIDRAAPQGEVLYFSGPLASAGESGSKASERLKAKFDDFLDGRRVAAAIGALAAGADIVLAEALLDAGVALHVHLPLAPTDFLASSVAPSGEDWRQRFIACIERAQTIEWTRRTKPSRGAYRLGSRIAMGRAIRLADELSTTPFAYFAVQRGRTAADSVSHENAELWRSLGLGCDSVLDDWAPTSPPRGVDAAATYRAALIVDAPVGDAATASALFQSRAGGLGVFAFKSTCDALAAARAAAASKDGAKAKIWLDIGIVDETTNAGREAFPAALVTASCRPLTTPGKAYASEGFVCAAAATPQTSQRFEYIGIAATDEKLDPCPLFLVDL